MVAADLRTRWRDLVGRRLPEAARSRRDWPVRLDHCFARIFLDNALGRPWREVVHAPAWRNAPEDRLVAALAPGGAVLAGGADLAALNRRSLGLRRNRGGPVPRIRSGAGSLPSGRGDLSALGPTVETCGSPPAPFLERKGRDRDP
jgi:hypothetical protein